MPSRLARAALGALLTLSLLIGPPAVAAQQPAGAPPAPQPPPSPAPDPRFGVVEAFWLADEAARLGVGWQRIIFYWSDLQPTGPKDWTGYFPDAVIDSERKAGRQVVGLLIGTPGWAAKRGQVTEAPRAVPAGLDLPVDHPQNHWASFVKQIVGHYKGRIDHWIVWNEPDVWGEARHGATWAGTEADYYLLLKNAYLAAKSVNPGSTVLFSGLTYWWDAKYDREQYLERVLRIAAADPTAPANNYYFDVLPLHLYHVVPYVPFVIGKYRQLLARYGLHKPIWINELNVVPYDDPVHPIPRIETRSTLEEQAHFVVQAIAIALAAGVERISLYKMTDDQVMKRNLTEPYGLVGRDRRPRPAFDAYRTVIRHYAGTRAARYFNVGEVEGVALDRGAKTTLVLWNASGLAERAAVAALSARATLVEPTGAERELTTQDGWYELTLPRATREWEEAELASFTIGGKPAIVVFDAPADALTIRGAQGTLTVRPTAPDSPATPVADVAPASEPAGGTAAREAPDPTVLPDPVEPPDPVDLPDPAEPAADAG